MVNHRYNCVSLRKAEIGWHVSYYGHWPAETERNHVIVAGPTKYNIALIKALRGHYEDVIRIAEFRPPLSPPLRFFPAPAKPAPASGCAAQSPPGRADRVRPWDGDRGLAPCPRYALAPRARQCLSELPNRGYHQTKVAEGPPSRRRRSLGKRFSQRSICKVAADVSL